MVDTAAAVAHSASSQNGLFSFDPGVAIWTWVVFALLFIVLRKYAWTPLMESVQKREQMMSETVQNAQKTREELEQIALRQKEMMAEAEEKANQLAERSRLNAEDAARRITERATAQAQKDLEQSRQQIGTEKEKALQEIRNETVDLIIQTSGKLIEESLDDDLHRKIVQRQLENL
jgi:F-type H+-transporting ATPase subunit b